MWKWHTHHVIVKVSCPHQFVRSYLVLTGDKSMDSSFILKEYLHPDERFSALLSEHVPRFGSGKEVWDWTLTQTQDRLSKQSLTDAVLTQQLLCPSCEIICVKVGVLVKLKQNLYSKKVHENYEFWHLNLFLTYICYLLLSDGWEDCLERLLRELRWGKRLRDERVGDTCHPLQRVLKVVSKPRK